MKCCKVKIAPSSMHDVTMKSYITVLHGGTCCPPVLHARAQLHMRPKQESLNLTKKVLLHRNLIAC